MKPNTNSTSSAEAGAAHPRVFSFVAHNKGTSRSRPPLRGLLNPAWTGLAGEDGWPRALAGILLAITVLPATLRGTLLWDGNATNGLGVFKLINIEGTNGSSVTAVSDPVYGTVWQFYKALNDHRCEAHGAAGINPAIGQTYYIGWRTKFVLPTQADLNAIFQWKAYGTPMLQNYPITIAPGGGALNLNQFNPTDAGGQTFLWSTPLTRLSLPAGGLRFLGVGGLRVS